MSASLCDINHQPQAFSETFKVCHENIGSGNLVIDLTSPETERLNSHPKCDKHLTQPFFFQSKLSRKGKCKSKSQFSKLHDISFDYLMYSRKKTPIVQKNPKIDTYVKSDVLLLSAENAYFLCSKKSNVKIKQCNWSLYGEQ